MVAPTQAVAESTQLQYPRRAPGAAPLPPLGDRETIHLQVEHITAYIRSRDRGVAGGLSGWTFDFLKQFIDAYEGDAGVMHELATFLSHIINNSLPPEAAAVLKQVRGLVFKNEETNKLRPIAIVESMRGGSDDSDSAADSE